MNDNSRGQYKSKGVEPATNFKSSRLKRVFGLTTIPGKLFLPFLVSLVLILLVKLGNWIFFAETEQMVERETISAEVTIAEECNGPSPFVMNAIYSAKLKNARAKNLELDSHESKKFIKLAEESAKACDEEKAIELANKAYALAEAKIINYQNQQNAN